MVMMERSRSVSRWDTAMTIRPSTFGREAVFIPTTPTSRGWRLAGWDLGGTGPTLGVLVPRPGPFRTGDPAGRRSGDPGAGVNDRAHLAYPSRRTLAWRAASVIAGPSTTGCNFALWEAGGAHSAGRPQQGKAR